MGTIIADFYDHEGYGARCLPDGTLTVTWSAETDEFETYVAACSCRWHGGQHPPTDEGYEAAVDEWEHDHAGRCWPRRCRRTSWPSSRTRPGHRPARPRTALSRRCA